MTVYDQLDDVCLYLYIVEGAVKLIGLGIEKYWEDDWNKFDCIMILFSLFSNLLYTVISVVRSAKSAKAGKLLRLTKLNRVFKMFRALRTVKIVNFFLIGADAFNQVKLLIQRIFMCIPFSNFFFLNKNNIY